MAGDEILNGIQCSLPQVVIVEHLKLPEEFDEEVRTVFVLRDQCRHLGVNRLSKGLEQREITSVFVRFPVKMKSNHLRWPHNGSVEIQPLFINVHWGINADIKLHNFFVLGNLSSSQKEKNRT